MQDPGDAQKHHLFYASIESLIKYWLLRYGIKEDIDGHAKSIFSDLYIKEQKRFESGNLVRERCTALITTYYFPVIKNLCFDYVDILNSRIPIVAEVAAIDKESRPGVFEALWGEHKNTVLVEMSRGVNDWIEFSSFEPAKKEYLRMRFIDGYKFPEIFKGADNTEFERQRKWICRQGKKIAMKIANKLLPAIIDCYRLPISKKIDPKIIEKHLLGLRTKIAV